MGRHAPPPRHASGFLTRPRKPTRKPDLFRQVSLKKPGLLPRFFFARILRGGALPSAAPRLFRGTFSAKGFSGRVFLRGFFGPDIFRGTFSDGVFRRHFRRTFSAGIFHGVFNAFSAAIFAAAAAAKSAGNSRSAPPRRGVKSARSSRPQLSEGFSHDFPRLPPHPRQKTPQ